jgi:phosphotransferase system, enzyme I, PtsP
MLRASVDADLRIMFPMISSLDEFCQAREVVWQAMADLKRKNIGHNANPQLGMMVELPCVVHLMDELAQEVDFFSIGTNDFIQFMLGVDRTNDSVADCYLPHHPAVLHGLHTIVHTATEHGRTVSICGDMAHEPRYIPFLLRIGVRALSVDPAYLLRTQQTIRATSILEAEDFAQTLLAQKRISDIDALLPEAQ